MINVQITVVVGDERFMVDLDDFQDGDDVHPTFRARALLRYAIGDADEWIARREPTQESRG